MNWLLPVTLVLLAGVLIGGLHALFIRWMARHMAPAVIPDRTPNEHTPDDSRR